MSFRDHGKSGSGMLFRTVLAVALAVGLLAMMLLGQAAAASGPGIVSLYSPSHPDQDTWYPDNQPQFAFSAALGASISGSYDSPGQARAVAFSPLNANRAYVADGGSGLQVIDVSNPASPLLLGSLDTTGTAMGMAAIGQYALVADDSDLQSVDMSNPAEPVLRNTYSEGSFKAIAVQDQYAYIAAGPSVGLKILDISDPANPKKKDGYISADSTGGQGIAVAGQYAYLADGAAGLKIIDVSDPGKKPLPIVGTCNTPGSARDVAVDGKRVYVADGTAGLQVIDISDYAHPQLVGAFDTSYSRGVETSDGYAYVVDDNNGLYVIDVSDPANLVQAAHVDTPGTPYGLTLAGGRTYVADYNSGVQIISVQGAEYSYVLDQVADSTPDETSEGAARSMQLDAPDGISYFHVRARDTSGVWGPAAHRKVQIGDPVSPVIGDILPSGTINTDSAVVTAYYSDPPPSSGIDLSSASLEVSGGTVDECDVTPEKISCMVSGLGLGDHDIDVSVADNSGNTANGSGSFIVIDDTPPEVSGIVPAGTIFKGSAAVTAYFDDPAPSSGIDTDSASMSVYGGTVSDCEKTEDYINCQVTGLDAGDHDIDVTVSDNAGNSGSGSGSFTVASKLSYFLTFYDYGQANTGLIQMGHDEASGVCKSGGVWFSGAGNWEMSRSKSSPAGPDGELFAMYNYGNSTTGIFRFEPNGSGHYDSQRVWLSGSWDWSRSKGAAATDQYGNSGYAVLYNYGNANTGLWLFDLDEDTGSFTPHLMWASGWGNFDWSRAQLVSGDFNGDGVIELGAFYDYGNSNTGFFVFEPGSGYAPQLKWFSGPGNFDLARGKITAGDFDGDGITEPAILYNYGNSNTGLWIFDRDESTGLFAPHLMWSSGWGNFDWLRAKVSSGDLNGDGETEVAALYDYGNNNTSLFLFGSQKQYKPESIWNSGAGNWNLALSVL